MSARDASPSPRSTGAPPQELDRRRVIFTLASLAALITATTLRACGSERPAQSPLERFLALSVLLTGFDDLPATTAQTYLGAILRDPELAGRLDALYSMAGYLDDSPPRSLEDLTARGIFRHAHLGGLADRIILWWYTGVYDGPEGPVVATYTGSLASRALSYTNPPSVCGGPMGFWAEPPVG